MIHLKLLGIKFIIVAVIVFSLFSILYNASLINLFWISVTVTGISYVIGDLFILQRFGNIAAFLGDFGLAFLTIWTLAGLLFPEGIEVTLLSLAAAFFFACSELFFHIFIEDQFSDDGRREINLRTKPQLQTEFAEESDPQTMTRKKKR